MKFTVSCKNGFAIASMVLMLLAAGLRLSYYRGLTGADWWYSLGLPLLSALLYVCFLPLWGKRSVKPLCLPVLGGVLFFVRKAFTFASPLHTALCCLLYAAVLLITCLTFFGVIRTRALLYPLFGLPLLVHLAMDVDELLLSKSTLWCDFPPEASVLCIMAALLCLSLALKKEFIT